MEEEYRAVKLVIRKGYNNDYAVYMGRPLSSDENVAASGVKLFSDEAEAVRRMMFNKSVITADWMELEYRR